jgi:hypothetical protein
LLSSRHPHGHCWKPAGLLPNTSMWVGHGCCCHCSQQPQCSPTSCARTRPVARQSLCYCPCTACTCRTCLGQRLGQGRQAPGAAQVQWQWSPACKQHHRGAHTGTRSW